MRTNSFWTTVEQLACITVNTCHVALSQGQETLTFERDQIQRLKDKCEHYLRVLDEERELALNRGNGLKPSEKSCEEISHTTSEKQ
ncbi:hypothetical protein ACY3XD_000480 [Vibrio cholerae]|uniref:hypothetical protein n=1 Tax=Vibrio cholerae TaxID=666 RepID=UPI00050C5D1A|nr:hypothetical protein [Vibrio cholerae]KQA26108.1 hypothetical protein AAY53_11270 [Vibrio metoecus]EGQ9730533.1 hypothetical protein [Vibrio cholerae]EGQ9965943.1 hypothetical protein [Vibrio cholerae]EGR0286653.1 hypothetical protein [Vibrio cholerae]EGR0549251.1 hypothetical protein [Vibrio cholerae]